MNYDQLVNRIDDLVCDIQDLEKLIKENKNILVYKKDKVTLLRSLQGVLKNNSSRLEQEVEVLDNE